MVIVSDDVKKQIPAKNSNTVYVGCNDLTQDAEAIGNLIKDPKMIGVVMTVSQLKKDDIYIYRPATPSPTDQDVVKEVRKFLSLVAVLQGRTAITGIQNSKEIAQNTLDFDEVIRYLKEKSVLFNNDI